MVILQWSSDALALRRFPNQLLKTLLSRLFCFGADDPPVHHFLIIRWLCLKELPGFLVTPQFCRVRLDQLGTSLFVGVDAGTIFLALFVSFQSGRMHSFFFDQSIDVSSIDCTPDAARPARSKTNLEAIF